MADRTAGPSTGYDDAVRAWAGRLRAGATTTWAEFLSEGMPGEPVDVAPLGGAQLEVVRRLAPRGLPAFDRLADIVLVTPGPGRGMVDVPLPWPDGERRFGTPPVEPELLPPEELLRVCVGVLVRLLVDEPPAPEAPAPRRARAPWRRGFTLLGAPSLVPLVRRALLDRGLREGGPRTTYLVLGGPLEDLMAQRWAARVRAGDPMKWIRMWRAARAHDRVPPGIDLPGLAGRLAAERGGHRVHVVLGRDPDEVVTNAGRVLGVDLRPPDDIGVNVPGTDLLRRLNPPLVLAAGEAGRRRIVQEVWPRVAPNDNQPRLLPPPGLEDWAERSGRRMADALRRAADAGDYAVHGDPELVVPPRSAEGARTVDPEAVLGYALEVVGRTWRAAVERDEQERSG